MRSFEKHFVIFEAPGMVSEHTVPFWSVSTAEKLMENPLLMVDQVSGESIMPTRFRFETRLRGRVVTKRQSEWFAVHDCKAVTKGWTEHPTSR